jgi:8-oxo-dGTP pyrophosphatase MutT (NUDIX family)
MPHIHTDPGHHDITVSAWVIRKDSDQWKCLVHFHKKMDTLMQIGGHVELEETPWRSLSVELKEEAGYSLSQLSALQHSDVSVISHHNVQHPVPFAMNTHDVGSQHFHTDLCYGFVTDELPESAPNDQESTDLRWLTIDELQKALDENETLADVVQTYRALIAMQSTMSCVAASSFSTEDPTHATVTYKRGAVER